MGEKKKINTVLFMVIATLFNVALIFIFFILLMLLLSLIMKYTNMGENAFTIGSVIVIVLSFVLSFLVYKKAVEWANNKWDIGPKGKSGRD